MKLEVEFPFDESAERAVLGTMLEEPQRIPLVLEHLSREDFFIEEHRLLFDVIVSLYEKFGEEWDEIALKSEIEKRGLEQRLPISWIEEIAEENVSEMVESACKIVRELSLRRKIVETGVELIREAKNPDNIDSILDGIIQKAMNLAGGEGNGGLYSAKEGMELLIEELEKLSSSERAITGLPTGLEELDMITTGFHPGELIVVAARPGMGKTAFGLQVAYHVASKESKPVVFFSLEMDVVNLMSRLAAYKSLIPIQKIRSGFLTEEEKEKILASAVEIAKAPLYIYKASSMTISKLKMEARKFRKELGVELIVVDYLQYLRTDTRRGSRQEEVAEISRELKSLAQELSVPVVALAQLSRETEKRSDKRPQLSDLRESGQIEQDADLIIFLHRPAYYKENPDPIERIRAEIIVAKHRQGPTGKIELAFVPEYSMFAPLGKEVYTGEEEEKKNVKNDEVDETSFDF